MIHVHTSCCHGCTVNTSINSLIALLLPGFRSSRNIIVWVGRATAEDEIRAGPDVGFQSLAYLRFPCRPCFSSSTISHAAGCGIREVAIFFFSNFFSQTH
jgi:hypothetical protein